MHILIDSSINTRCKHRICALRILIISLLECLEDHEISAEPDMPQKIDLAERNENIVSITFIN